MIYLKKGQALADNPTMVVYDQTGYYNDGDSIICAPAYAPEEPACRYEAKFVAYGGMVYSISDPDELLAEIIKIDPKSLYGKNSQQVAVDKIVENIVPQESGTVPTDQAAQVTEEVKEQETPTEQQTTTATTTPAIATPINNSTSTTTPAVSTTTPSGVVGGNSATSTPGTVLFPDTTSTTTPPFDISSTTPGIVVPVQTNPATTTPPEILIPTPDTNISTTSPVMDTSQEQGGSTSTDTTIIQGIDPILETPSQPDQPTDTSTTTEEVVALAKRFVKSRISKKLGL